MQKQEQLLIILVIAKYCYLYISAGYFKAVKIKNQSQLWYGMELCVEIRFPGADWRGGA